MCIKIILVIFCLSLYSCGKKESSFVHFNNPPREESINRVHDVRSIFQDAKIDILFVVDNSGSMGSIQKNIVKNSALFMQEFLKSNFMNWRMGIVSTDQNELPYLGFANWFDNNLLTRLVDPLSEAEVVAIFQTAINQLGTNGSAYEYVFYNALRPMLNPLNKGFFRREAHQAIIMVTDENEQSEDEFGSQFDPLSFVNAVKSTKNPGKIVRFYGALNLRDLQGCKHSMQDPYKGSPYEAVINETNGIVMSACTSDFGRGLAEIGKDIISIVDSPRILLEERPVVETLEVYYNDLFLEPGKKDDGGIWYYSYKYNTVNFYDLDFAPDFKDTNIRIKYEIDDGVDREPESKS